MSRWLRAQIEMQAKVLYKQVVITRRWVAEHGGVFIESCPVETPYLRNPSIVDVSGRHYGETRYGDETAIPVCRGRASLCFPYYEFAGGESGKYAR
jgi:hypothetical protein